MWLIVHFMLSQNTLTSKICSPVFSKLACSLLLVITVTFITICTNGDNGDNDYNRRNE
jgi:hypothetical protein